MDFKFHLQQGQHLLNKRDGLSIRKALEHFKTANVMSEDVLIAKPKTLYYLALGNLHIGQVANSYRIAHKAKRSLDLATERSVVSMGNMRQLLGEEQIDKLIRYIEEKHLQLITMIDVDDDDFDENDLDFSLVDRIYKTTHKPDLRREFSIETLSDDVLYATFAGQSRADDELVYFDKLKGDVLSHVEGYFSSLIGDQGVMNRRLADRILKREPVDFVDDDRYVLIERLDLSDFLEEFKKQSNGKEPFYSLVDYFLVDVLGEYQSKYGLNLDELTCNSGIQRKFHDYYAEKLANMSRLAQSEYQALFNKTCKALAIRWIEDNV